MRGSSRAGRSRLSHLLASSSVAAILIGGGAPSAFAACTSVTANYSNGATVTGLCVTTSFTGNIDNTGTISPSGIKFTNGTITGQINSSGVINGGILLDHTSKIASGSTAILLTGSIFTGGISNAGTLSAAADFGIYVTGVSSFAGGISNSGTISAGANGIAIVGDTSFLGGISNSGTILSSSNGIALTGVAQFGSSGAGGGISNSGTISAANRGIYLHAITTFIGGISNSGTITATNGSAAIFVSGVTTFLGAISNSGKIVASQGAGIVVTSVAQFGSASAGGGITNSGTISAVADGIGVGAMATFVGNISNSGTILAAGGGFVGIDVENVGAFTGGISNSGTISSAAASGISVGDVTTFADGISNSGTISAALNGVFVGSNVSFAGGVNNSGTIVAVGSGNGINVNNDTHFTGGISNSGTISAGGAGIYAAFVPSFSGNISNSGRITGKTGIVIAASVTFAAGISNSGTIVNTGTITGTGGTAIDLSADTSPVTVDVDGGAISGNVIGAGTASGDTVNFALGSGSFVYANTITGMLAVNINSGTLFDSGAITAAGVVVNSGGTLAPGAPGTIGALTIGGDLAFTGGDYEVQLTPGTNSFATVSGNLSISNGTVALSPSGPLGTHYSGRTFSILTYGGTLTRSFNPIVSYVGAVGLSSAPTISYLGDTVDLTYGNAVADLATPAGANQNQRNVIGGIDNAIVAGDAVPAGFQQLVGLNGAALLNAYSQLDGADATGAQTSAFQLMTDFLNLLSDPTADGGGGGGTGGPQQFAPNDQASLPPEIAEAYNHVLRNGTPQPQDFEQRWSAWASGFGGSSTIDGNTTVGSSNVTASDYGYAAGMTYHATPSTSYGFALAGGGTNWNVTQSLGSGRSDSFQAGVYGTSHFGPAYLSGALAFANHWFSTNRIVLGDNLTANFQGQSYAARGEAGYRYGLPITGYIIGVTPYAAVQVQDFHTPGYSETDLTGGGLGLTYASLNATDTRSELGARFDNLTVWNGMPLVLRGRLAWAHDWVSDPALGAVFQTLPGSNFTVNGAAPPKNSALTTAAAELHLNANWTAMAKFDGAFGSGAQTYAGTGTIRYSW